MNESVATSQPAVPKRRTLLVGAVAAGAALAGGGVAAWRHFGADAENDAAVNRLWTLDFQTPQGQTLAMAALRGRPLLVNFWATWCPPCVEELPLLDAFYRQNAANRWQVIGLAIDQPSAVRNFLQRTPVSFPVGFAGLEGTELTKALGNTVGGLPFSVVVGADGRIRERRMGRLSQADLQGWVAHI